MEFGFNADQCWYLPVTDFFTYVSFINAERRAEARKQQQELARMRGRK